MTKILFVHQNFPGQYKHLAQHLAATGAHEIVALGQNPLPALSGIRFVRYAPHRPAAKTDYALSQYWEECAGNGFGAAEAAQKLATDGFTPDIILGHIGWGELTFLKIVWPHVPILGYFEYFYLAQGGTVGFDPEYPASEHAPYIMHARNSVNFANIQTVDRGLCPTNWQHDTFPESFHNKLYVCHDGIRTDRLSADPKAQVSLGRLAAPVTRKDEIFTFMARNLEPTRGFHQFMRALPLIQAARPNARAIIIGGNEASYGRQSASGGGYRAEMEAEIGHKIDWSRVHFVGRVPYADFCKILQVSRCHIYLTVPFVLSWSLLEAMAMQAVVVASDVAPVREAIEDGETGLLVDFFDPEALAQRVVEVLSAPRDFQKLGQAARAQVCDRYDFLRVCLPQHLAEMNALLPEGLHLPGASA